ncbi:hypothetical protein GF354_06165 [Candidatus Peregrinibacteria bacterium]|nr:hypothetical protein [Candidatus Peregrinibacteria bacterium]
MTKEERKRLLHDEWPKPSADKKKEIINVINKASKAKIFEYKETETDCCLHP